MAEGRGHEKQAGAMVYLMEELGDARLRCDQLQRYIDQAIQIIEKSKHKDHLFEVAGDLIRGVPETVFKLHKSLQAVALAAGRIDYEEIKQDLRPEKAEELERVLKDVRIRHVQRRSEPMMKPIEALNVLKALKASADTGKFPLMETLSLVASLEEGLPKEASASTDFEKLAGLLANPPEGTPGPSRKRLAQILRHVVANHIGSADLTALRVAGNVFQEQQKRELKELEDLLKKHGYDPKDAKALQKEGMGLSELEGRLKHKPGSKGSLEDTHGLKKKASSNDADDFGDREAVRDIKDLNQLRKALEDILVEARRSKNKEIEELAKKQLSKLASTVVVARTGGDPRWLTAKYPGKTSDGEDFKKGEKVLYFPNSKTFLKGPKADAAWRKFEAEAADEAVYNFKGAGEEDKRSRFEEGKPADPTKDMTPEDAKKWKENTEEYGDKFKTAAGALLDEDSDSAMAGPIIRALKAAYKAGETATGLDAQDVGDNVSEAVSELRDLLKVLDRQPSNALPKLSEVGIHVWQLAYYLGASKHAAKTASLASDWAKFEDTQSKFQKWAAQSKDVDAWFEEGDTLIGRLMDVLFVTPASSAESAGVQRNNKFFMGRLGYLQDMRRAASQNYQDFLKQAKVHAKYWGTESNQTAVYLHLKSGEGSKTAGDDDKRSRFEEGKPADPTKDMTPEDAKKWKENTEEYGDKFKTAASLSEKDLWALAICWVYKPSGRRRSFLGAELGEFSENNPHIKKLIQEGLLQQKGNSLVVDKVKARKVFESNKDKLQKNHRLLVDMPIEVTQEWRDKKATVDPWKAT